MPIHTAAVAVEPQPTSLQRRPASARPAAPEFPGCRPIPLEREELSTCDDRFEYWDGDTETAWVVSEPTSATHEQPSQRLAGVCHVIAGVRGSPVECYGTMDLLLRNERGERWRIIQADQSIYLHPSRAPRAGRPRSQEAGCPRFREAGRPRFRRPSPSWPASPGRPPAHCGQDAHVSGTPTLPGHVVAGAEAVRSTSPAAAASARRGCTAGCGSRAGRR